MTRQLKYLKTEGLNCSFPHHHFDPQTHYKYRPLHRHLFIVNFFLASTSTMHCHAFVLLFLAMPMFTFGALIQKRDTELDVHVLCDNDHCVEEQFLYYHRRADIYKIYNDIGFGLLKNATIKIENSKEVTTVSKISDFPKFFSYWYLTPFFYLLGMQVLIECIAEGNWRYH